jgi:tRNA(fMet)-specific endonuclease VapC
MKLRYLLDTNICIYIAKQKPISVLKRFEKMKPGEAGMSIITYGELLHGAEKSQHPKKTKEALSDLIYLIPALPLINEVSEHYAHIRANLEKLGKPIGNNDLWIASHASALNVVLVTNNTKEFARVPHLKIENWV